MKEDQLINESTDNLSDEEFLKNYEKHNKTEGRSNKYNKKNQSVGIKSGYWIFLAFVFIACYFLFTKFLFVSVP